MRPLLFAFLQLENTFQEALYVSVTGQIVFFDPRSVPHMDFAGLREKW